LKNSSHLFIKKYIFKGSLEKSPLSLSCLHGKIAKANATRAAIPVPPTIDNHHVIMNMCRFGGLHVYLRYAPRRVACVHHGIHVERVPWAEGKEHMTKSYQSFLARWAKRLSWKEVADIFKTSWESIYRAVKWVVDYGSADRDWDNVEQIGIDELSVFKGHRYLTCVYQLDKGHRRLLWCGMDRRVKTLLRFFRVFGKERSAKLHFVCSDMWKPYLKVIKKKAINALNILDRFHIMKKFNEAIDEVRRQEVKKLQADEKENVLANGRWLLLK